MKIRRPQSPSARPSPKGQPTQAGARASDKSHGREPVHVGGAVTAPSGPFSRQIDVAQAEDKTLRVTITANEAECAELALQDALPAIAQFSAKFEVTSAGRGRFEVKGEVRARQSSLCWRLTPTRASPAWSSPPIWARRTRRRMFLLSPPLRS